MMTVQQQRGPKLIFNWHPLLSSLAPATEAGAAAAAAAVAAAAAARSRNAAPCLGFLRGWLGGCTCKIVEVVKKARKVDPRAT